MVSCGASFADDGLVDAVGVRHEPVASPPRIVSLVPSLTELLFDLGLDANVVGRTHYCVRPPSALATVPSVGGTKKIRFDRLVALKPSHVLVNIDETPKDLADRLAAAGITVVVTHPIEPSDNLRLYALLGELFNRRTAAVALASRFHDALSRLTMAAGNWPRRRVLYLIWRQPWMTVSRDTYIAKLLALANWVTVGHDPDRRYPEFTLTPETLAGIDLILLSSEPFWFGEADRKKLAEDLGPAAPPVVLIDGEMLSWYGSRAILGLDYLRTYAAAVAD